MPDNMEHNRKYFFFWNENKSKIVRATNKKHVHSDNEGVNSDGTNYG